MAAEGAGKIVGAFNEVAQTNLSNIGTAGDMSKLTGMSFREAQKDIEEFTRSMSIQAAALPGDTAGFVSLGVGIADNLVPAFKDLNGAFDKDAFDEYREAIAVAGAVRADFSGITTADSSLAISKLLGGASTAELKTLKFFEANPAVLAFVEQEIAEAGKDIKELSKKELADITKNALEVSDEVLEAAANSTSGLIAGFKSGLLDPNTGIFGLARDLDTATEGSQSVFSTFSRLIVKILGEGGLFANMGEILDNIGLDADPMQMLADGLGKVGMWLDKANKYLSGIALMSDDSRGFNATRIFKKAQAGVVNWLSNLFNRAFRAAGSMDSVAVGKKIGALLANGIDNATQFIANLSFVDIAKSLYNIGNAIAIGLISAVRQMNWLQAAEALASVALVAGLAIGAAFAATFVSISAPIMAAITAASVVAVATIAAIADRVLPLFNGIGDAIKRLIQGMKDRLAQMMSIFNGSDGPSGFTGRRTTGNRASGLDQGGLLAAVARERKAMPSGATIQVANSSELIANSAQQKDIFAALSSRGGNSLSVGNITINAGNTNNPELLAQQVMAKIDIAFRKMSQQSFSAQF